MARKLAKANNEIKANRKILIQNIPPLSEEIRQQ